MTRWIKTSERLPDHQDEVFVYAGEVRRGFRWVTNDGQWYIAEHALDGYEKSEDVTHWMEHPPKMPEPPEADE